MSILERPYVGDLAEDVEDGIRLIAIVIRGLRDLSSEMEPNPDDVETVLKEVWRIEDIGKILGKRIREECHSVAVMARNPKEAAP